MKFYGEFLKKKYGSEEKLKKAWKREDASFDKPVVPNVQEQYFIFMEEGIMDAMKYYESADRIIGKNIDMDAEKAANLGVFLNMEDYRYVADFYDAFHEVTADAIIYFARLLKERYAGKIVGAFYGSYGCTDFFNSSTATSTLPILDCGYVDFLAAPGFITTGSRAAVWRSVRCRIPSGSAGRCLWRRRTAGRIWRTVFTGMRWGCMM